MSCLTQSGFVKSVRVVVVKCGSVAFGKLSLAKKNGFVRVPKVASRVGSGRSPSGIGAMCDCCKLNPGAFFWLGYWTCASCFLPRVMREADRGEAHERAQSVHIEAMREKHQERRAPQRAG